MSDIGTTESIGSSTEDLLTTHPAGGATDRDASDADAQAFQQLLEGGGRQPTEQEQQEQFDKNFQTMSYLFMKGVYSHVEEAIRREQ